ncbi:MAG: rRNA maturation RNase YbeY [Firmicutes bacterium]|nr:rRNA maturation RNase YbeY [Bacillota bacterium]
MFTILVNNDAEYKQISEDSIRDLALKIYEASGIEGKGEVSLTFLSDEEIQQLNKDYRQIDKPTDVLTFPQSEGMDIPMPDDENFEPLIGDIIISVETAERQAAEQGHPFSKEVAVLLIHGILHLHGFDHIEDEDYEKMKAEEDRILEAISQHIK